MLRRIGPRAVAVAVAVALEPSRAARCRQRWGRCGSEGGHGGGGVGRRDRSHYARTVVAYVFIDGSSAPDEVVSEIARSIDRQWQGSYTITAGGGLPTYYGAGQTLRR